MPDGFPGKVPVKQLHYELGWEGRVFTDEYLGTDPGTGRDTWEEDDVGQPAIIRVERYDQPQTLLGAGSGEEHTAEAVIIVDPSEVDVTDGAGDFSRPSEIVDLSTNTRFRVLRKRDEHSGVLRLDCEVMTG